jgi:hypothetical protein
MVRVLLHAGFLLGSFSTLKMEASCPLEESVDFHQTLQRYVISKIELLKYQVTRIFATRVKRLYSMIGVP